GLAELAAGLLLLARRTQLFGALLTIAIFANIAVIDFCYEVGPIGGVKLVALVGLAAGLYLAASDGARLRALLLGGEAPPPRPHPFGPRGRGIALVHAGILLVW